MIKFCIMLSYFSIIFVLIVSGIVGEENNTFSFGNETVIANKSENQTLKVNDHKLNKDYVLDDVKPKISPAANKTLRLKTNGNNKDQKNSVSSKLAEVQLDESHNWKDFQNGTFTTTVVNKVNKTVKIKIRKVKLNHTLDDRQDLSDNPSIDHNTSSNYTDQEPSGSSILSEIGTFSQNRKFFEIENDKRFDNWKDIGLNSFSDVSRKNLTTKGENLSDKVNFEKNRNAQLNTSTTLNIIPSHPDFRLENPSETFSIIQNNTQNFNDWRGMDTFAIVSNTKDEKVDLFQNFSQSFAEEGNSTTSTSAPSPSNGTSFENDLSGGFLEGYEKSLENETHFHVDSINFDNSSDWKGIDFGTNETIKANDQEALPNLDFQQKSNIEYNSNVTSHSSNDNDYALKGMLNQFKVQYLNENRKLLQNQINSNNFNQIRFNDDGKAFDIGVLPVTTNGTSTIKNQIVNVSNNSNIADDKPVNQNFNPIRFNNGSKVFDTGVLPSTANRTSLIRNQVVSILNNSIIRSIDGKSGNQNNGKNFSQIRFDDNSDWKAIVVELLPITTNNTSTIRDQTVNFSSNVDGKSNNEITQPPLINRTLDFSTKSRYADYQPSGSADNFQLQPLGENFEEINQDTFTDVDNQEQNFDEVQISKPSVNNYEFEDLNFENGPTEKFIANSNWNLEQEEWKAINGNSKRPHVGTQTEIKIENHVPFPYPIVKTVLYPVEKQVPFPIKVDIPSPYPVIKEVHVPKKVTVPLSVPIYKPVPVEKVVKYPVRVPVDQPYPVQVKVPRYYPVEVQIPFPVKVKVPQPIQIIKKVPYEVKHVYHVPKPYPVNKNVYYPVKVHFERLVRYNVYKPFPVKVFKNVYFPYYIEKPYPVKVYEDKGVRAPVEKKPEFFNHGSRPTENHQPFLYDNHPEAIPVYEDNQEKPPSELESNINAWKVNYDPFGEINA